MNKKAESWCIPTYIINLKVRTERRTHMTEQFSGRSEFNITWVEAVEHPVGAIGLWESIVKIVQLAKSRNEDMILICEDDHVFTDVYTSDYLLYNLVRANRQECDLLSGGIGGFGTAVPVDINRYWIDWFYSTQFIIIFQPLFNPILSYDFKEGDTADGVLSQLSHNAMTVYPFLSIQRDFGYSDVTKHNNRPGSVKRFFAIASQRLSLIHYIYHKNLRTNNAQTF